MSRVATTSKMARIQIVVEIDFMDLETLVLILTRLQHFGLVNYSFGAP